MAALPPAVGRIRSELTSRSYCRFKNAAAADAKAARLQVIVLFLRVAIGQCRLPFRQHAEAETSGRDEAAGRRAGKRQAVAEEAGAGDTFKMQKSRSITMRMCALPCRVRVV